MREVNIKLYHFNELPETIQQKVIGTAQLAVEQSDWLSQAMTILIEDILPSAGFQITEFLLPGTTIFNCSGTYKYTKNDAAHIWGAGWQEIVDDLSELQVKYDGNMWIRFTGGGLNRRGFVIRGTGLNALADDEAPWNAAVSEVSDVLQKVDAFIRHFCNTDYEEQIDPKKIAAEFESAKTEFLIDGTIWGV